MKDWRDWKARASNSAMTLFLIASPVAGLAALTISPAAAAETGSTMVASYARIGGPTSVPYGWADFCRRYAGECDSGPLALLDINLTPKTMNL
ncbi:MAG: hypothetical protein ACLPKT_21790 [Methylocella sp.]